MTNKKAIDITKENYVFVKYSEIEDLRLKLNDASRALLNLGDSLAGIALMSTRKAEVEGLSAKSTATKDTKQNKQSISKSSDFDASEKLMAQRSKNTDLLLKGLEGGQRRKSRKR